MILGPLFGVLGFLFTELANDAGYSIFELMARLIYVIISGLIIGLMMGLIVGSICGFIFGLMSGFGNAEVVEKRFPNQGIRQSLVRTIIILAIGFIFANLFSIGAEKFMKGFTGYILLMSFNFANIFGGSAVLWHLSLRIVLTKMNKMPWDYGRFLNYSVDRLFLQRVGSHYHFSHDLFRQHFAKKYGN